jgi:hypothetical protein
MFKYIIPEYDPATLVKKNLPNNDFTFEVKRLSGLYYRTFPYTAREVFFLQTLSKGTTIHVPESGDGVIVRADIIDSLTR